MTQKEIQALCRKLNASPWQQSVLQEELSNRWHTGTPTEGGWYLFKVRHGDDIVYYANLWAKIIDYQWVYAMYGEVIGWQKIEQQEERKK